MNMNSTTRSRCTASNGVRWMQVDLFQSRGKGAVTDSTAVEAADARTTFTGRDKNRIW